MQSKDGRFGSKVGQISPKWDKSGAFSDHISVHFVGEIRDYLGPIPTSLLIEPNVLKSDLKKSRICPIWGPL